MKLNKWTLALATAGVVSLGSVAHAEEAANQVLTALSSTTLSGHIDTSINWRPGSDTGMIPGRTFDGAGKQDGFNLNVVQLSLEKPMDEGQWSAGYKVDLVFGPDAGYYGTGTTFGGADAGDFNIKQAYAALRAPVGNGIDFKMGVFDTIVGYEVFESGNNPNYSRSYGYALEPTHHTGVLATYHVNDMVSIAAGVANTWNAPINGRAGGGIGTPSESQKTFMGAVTITLPENTGMFAGSALYAGIVDGRAFADPAGEDSTSYYVGHTMATPIEGLAIGAAFDYADNPGGVSAHAWAVAAYASFQATEKLRLNARGDYAQGSAGVVYPSGNKNELVALTLTADYSLWSSLVTRLEGRWDHSLEGDAFASSPAFGASTDNDAFTVALNFVYKF